jgi:hypothetical protein
MKNYLPVVVLARAGSVFEAKSPVKKQKRGVITRIRQACSKLT